MAILTALSILLSRFEIPLVFFAPWIKLDFTWLPALLATFAFGALGGIGVLGITNLLQWLTHSTTGGIGEIGNFVLGAALILSAGLIYKRDYQLRHTKAGAWVGSAVGTVVTVLSALAVNTYFLIPLLMGSTAPLDNMTFMFGMSGLTGYLLTVTLPFNLLKSAIICGVLLLIYKPLSPILHGRPRR